MKNNSTYDLVGHCGRRWPAVISALALIAQITVCRAACLPTYEQLKSFGKPATGGNPYAGLIQGADGALYGTAVYGGSYGSGTVFKLNPDGTDFIVLQNLSPGPAIRESGGFLYAGLTLATDGALYGTAVDGGANFAGTVFKLNLDGSGFTVLHNFDFTTGVNPYGSLIQGADGALYGTAAFGGASGYGVVFKLNLDGTGFTVLKDFDYFTTGSQLLAGLIQGRDGALYGTATGGGSSTAGTVFKLNPDGTGFAVLHNFDGAAGYYPYAPLTQGTDGALYGTTTYGGAGGGFGVVFKLNPDGTGFAVLHNFDGSTTGGGPNAGLVQGVDGVFYGTAAGGGAGGYGTVFKLNSDGSGFRVLLDLDGLTDGGIPLGGLMELGGALYGTAAYGGTGGYGTAFKLNPDGTGFAVLHSFDLATTGGGPVGTLTPGPNGTIYGTTGGGGSAGAGTVFRLVPDDVPPTVSCSVAVSRLSPVNNQLVNVGLSATSSESDLQIQVFSDEPKVPVLQDATLTGGVLKLRARRDPGSDGRVYLITHDSVSDSTVIEEAEFRPPPFWRRRTRGPRGSQTNTQKPTNKNRRFAPPRKEEIA